jgi:hypothetical protein
MAHATRRDVSRPLPTPARAKPLRPTLPSTDSEMRPERRQTWRPPRRESGIEEATVALYRRIADSGICLGEEVVADLSKDPRHDDG